MRIAIALRIHREMRVLHPVSDGYDCFDVTAHRDEGEAVSSR